MRNFKTENIEKVTDINDYIYFIDDILESSGELSILEKSDVLGDSFEFPALTLNTTYKATDDIKSFENFLMEQFLANSKKSMTYIRQRKDILKHFRKYFIKNNTNLSTFQDIEPKTKEFNNICYHLYQGISEIFPEFVHKKDKFKAESIVKSPLVYKISLSLPDYIDIRKLMVKDFIIEKYLKEPELKNDNEVHIGLDKVNNNIVVTLLRFDNESRVSLGDIINYGTGYPYQLLRDSEFKLPCLMGLIDNEVPLIVDLEGNGTIAMVGVKDKSWLAYTMAINMVMSTHYDDVQFVILNQKDDAIWHMFSRMPHVLGYHSNVETFTDVIEDLYNVSQKRMKLAKKNKVKNFKDLKPLLGNHHAQMYMILDSSSQLLTYYKTFLNDGGTTFINTVDKLNSIAENSSLTGVSILAITQRADDNNLPEQIKEHAQIRVGMSGGSENDYQELFGRDVQETGVAVGYDSNIISYDNATTETEYIRTPIIGGLNNTQTLALIRVVALEWVRKSLYDVSVINEPDGLHMPFAYNRNIIARDSIEKIKEGKILPSW